MPTIRPNIKLLFDGIASRYDLTNVLLSFGLDGYWRWQTARRVAAASSPLYVLDVATGSGKLAFALRSRLPLNTFIVGLDFSNNMLLQARQQQSRKAALKVNLAFLEGSCETMPFTDNSVEAVTMAFGLRNLPDRLKGLKEIYRVLKKPGGQLWVLECSHPHLLLKPFYYLYLKLWVPLVGGWATGKAPSYRYLEQSIQGFPDQVGLSEELRQAGFKAVRFENFTGGVVALHCAEA